MTTNIRNNDLDPEYILNRTAAYMESEKILTIVKKELAYHNFELRYKIMNLDYKKPEEKKDKPVNKDKYNTNEKIKYYTSRQKDMRLSESQRKFANDRLKALIKK